MDKESQSHSTFAYSTNRPYDSSRPTQTSRSGKKSKSSLYKCLSSLKNLQNLKNNPQLHSLTYSELTQIRSLTPSTTSRPKSVRIKVLKPRPKEEYDSLDPVSLREKVPKKQREPRFPSEKRQLYLTKYSDYSEATRIMASPKNLESIWHQTLSAKSVMDYRNCSGGEGDRSKIESSLNGYPNDSDFPSQLARIMGSPAVKIKRDAMLSSGQKEKEDRIVETCAEEYRLAKKETNTRDAVYENVKKEVKAFDDLLKDFCKMVTHTQKSYQKAEEQQVELYDFASIFTQEINDLEKFPKESKVPRLNKCLQSVSQKIEDLKGQEELLKDQISHINELMSSNYVSSNQHKNNHSLLKANINDNETPSSYKIETKNMTPSNMYYLKTPQKMHLKLPNLENEGQQSTQETLDQYKVKREVMKIKISKPEGENYLTHKARPTSVKAGRSFTTTSSKNKRPSNISTHYAKERSPASQIYPNTEKSSSRPQSSISRVTGSLIYKDGSPKSPSSKTKDEFSLADSILGIKVGTALTRDYSEVNDELEELEEKEEKEEPWISATEAYESFSNLVKMLQKILQEDIEPMNVFKKDVDEKRSEDYNGDLLRTQSEQSFTKIMDKIQDHLSNIKKLKSVFLNNVSGHFEALQNLHESNILKLESFKNLIQASIEKSIQIEKYNKKYNFITLEDKTIRQKYEKRYDKLKEELIEFNKTMLFLASQFKFKLSLYNLNLISTPSEEDLLNLKSKSDNIAKTLYYMQNFPQLEVEYNEKTEIVYSEIKKAAETRKAIEDAFRDKTPDIVSRIREGEDMIGNIKTLKVKMASLCNKFEQMSKVSLLIQPIEKPLLVVVKLMKKLDICGKGLEDLFARFHEDITTEYNNLMGECETAENQVETHTKRLLNNKEHLMSIGWRQNQQIMEALKYDVKILQGKVAHFVKEEYPTRVPLLPKPRQKIEQLIVLEKRLDAITKTLSTTGTINTDNFVKFFSDLRSSNLTEQLQPLYASLQEEITKQEAIFDELDKEAILLKKMINEVLQLLRQLRTIFKRTFDLQERATREYLNFQGDYVEKDLTPQGYTYVLDNQRELYPQLFTIMAVDSQDQDRVLSQDKIQSQSKIQIRKLPSTNSVILEESIDSANTMNEKKFARGMTCTLSNLHQPEQQKTKINRMEYFIARMKGLLQGFVEEHIGIHKEEHILFYEIYTHLQELYNKELKSIEKAKEVIDRVQTSHIFYNKEIRPLANLHKCIDLLPLWNQKMENLLIVRHSMTETLVLIKGFEEDGNIRGGVEFQLMKSRQIQETVTHSITIITEILSFGRLFNEKEFKTHLGSHLRAEEVGLKEFVNLLDRKVEKLLDVCQKGNSFIEEDTAKLVEKFTTFIKSIVELLRHTELGYSEIFGKIAEESGLAEQGFATYMEGIHLIIKDLADSFCDNINNLATMTNRPTWVVKILDKFYGDIILKDLNVFVNLWENSKDIDCFIQEFTETFIKTELMEKKQYRKIAESNPSWCDSRVIKATELSQRLNFLTHSEELMFRSGLKLLLKNKYKYLQMTIKIYSMFALIYSMGMNIQNKTQAITSTKSIVAIVQYLPEIETMLQDMVKRLNRALGESKEITKGFDLGSNFNLPNVLKLEIIPFYGELVDWFAQFKKNLLSVANFYLQLRKNFKGKVYFLRDDWISFIKDWLKNSSVHITRYLYPITNDYQEFKEKLESFLGELQKHVEKSLEALREIVQGVQYLNQSFFQEWFFDPTYKDAKGGDKVFIRISNMINKVKGGVYDRTKLKEKLKDIISHIQECDKNFEYLANQELVKTVFEDGIESWDVIRKYYKSHHIGLWLKLLIFAETKLLFNPKNEVKKAHFEEKVQTLKGLFVYVEHSLKCSLNISQKEFLSVVYDLMGQNSALVADNKEK